MKPEVLVGWTKTDWRDYFSKDGAIELLGSFQIKSKDWWHDPNNTVKVRITVEEIDEQHSKSQEKSDEKT